MGYEEYCKAKIIEMVSRIESGRFLRQIYTLLRLHIEKKEETA